MLAKTVCWVTMVKVNEQQLTDIGTSLIGLQLYYPVHCLNSVHPVLQAMKRVAIYEKRVIKIFTGVTSHIATLPTPLSHFVTPIWPPLGPPLEAWYISEWPQSSLGSVSLLCFVCGSLLKSQLHLPSTESILERPKSSTFLCSHDCTSSTQLPALNDWSQASIPVYFSVENASRRLCDGAASDGDGCVCTCWVFCWHSRARPADADWSHTDARPAEPSEGSPLAGCRATGDRWWTSGRTDSPLYCLHGDRPAWYRLRHTVFCKLLRYWAN